jgi:hypothetical protein
MENKKLYAQLQAEAHGKKMVWRCSINKVAMFKSRRLLSKGIRTQTDICNADGRFFIERKAFEKITIGHNTKINKGFIAVLMLLSGLGLI